MCEHVSRACEGVSSAANHVARHWGECSAAVVCNHVMQLCVLYVVAVPTLVYLAWYTLEW